MGQVTLTNQNDAAEIAVVRHPFRSPTIAIASSTTAPAGCVIAIDLMLIQDEWIEGVGIFDAIAQSKVNFVTGAGQYAWTDAPTAIRARIRRTDATGTAAICAIDQVPA